MIKRYSLSGDCLCLVRGGTVVLLQLDKQTNKRNQQTVTRHSHAVFAPPRSSPPPSARTIQDLSSRLMRPAPFVSDRFRAAAAVSLVPSPSGQLPM